MHNEGDVISDRFELQKLAGRGGMGEVWRAEDRKTNRIVAIKFIWSNDTNALARFRRETRILAVLPHQHIVQYLGDGVTRIGEPWLAMEWLEGQDLHDILLRGPLGVGDTVRIGIRVARALGTAHAQAEPIVHRDVKPKNIFLVNSDPEQVKVLDFGIAFITNLFRITTAGSVMGSPGYMSPEQVNDIPEQIDPRVDVFVLGAVLFECLTQKRAFDSHHPYAAMSKILVDHVPRIADLRMDAPPALSRLIERMLDKNRQNRPADGNAVANELEIISLTTRPPGAADIRGASFSSRGPSAAGESPVIHVAQHDQVRGIFGPQSDRLSPQEKHLLFLVVAKADPKAETSHSEPSGTLRSAGIDPEIIAAVQTKLDTQNDRLYVLPGPALLIMAQGRGNPVEVACRAARLSLSLSRLLPDAKTAVVAARAEANDKQPVGTMLDDVFRLVDLPSPNLDDGSDTPLVRIDGITNAWLDARFDRISRLGETWVRGERDSTSVQKKLHPYIGREFELKSVRQHIERAWEQKRPAGVIALGDAGAGKSRLRFELIQELAQHRPGVSVVLGRGDPMRTNSAFSLVSSALRSAAEIRSGDPLAESQYKLLRFIGQYLSGAEARRTAEILGEVIGTPFIDIGRNKLHVARSNATLMMQLVQEAFFDFIKPLTKKTPLLLVLEELAYGDAASLNLVAAALDELQDHQFAVLGLASTDLDRRVPGLWQRRNVQRIQLNALHTADATRLARVILGNDAPDSVVRRIVTRSEGNPFYLEELCRAQAEGRGGPAPETVLGMVGARIDSLDADARRVLRAVSIFGDAAWESGIRLLVDGERGEPTLSLPQTLDLLVRQDFLEAKANSRFSGETEYRFRHELVREEAYARLVNSDLTLGHTLAAEWLLAAGEQDPSVLAFHFNAGGETARAVEHYIRAAELALSGGMLDTAIALATQGRVLDPKNAHQAVSWAITTDAESWKSNHTAAYDAARNALQFAKPGSRDHARALGSAIRSALDLDKRNEISDLLEQLLVVDPESDAILALSWAFRAVITTLLDHETKEALPYMKRMELITASAETREPAVTAWTLHTRAHWFRTVHKTEKEALEKALELDHASVKHFETIGVGRYLAYAKAHLAYDYLLLGAHEIAAETLKEALKDEPEDSFISMIGRTFQAELFLARGLVKDARKEAHVVAEKAAGRGERRIAKSARLIEARAAAALGEDGKNPQNVDDSDRPAPPGERTPQLAQWAHNGNNNGQG